MRWSCHSILEPPHEVFRKARDFHLAANLPGLVDDPNRSFFDRDVESGYVSCCAPSDACGRSTADHVYHWPEGLRLAFTAGRAGRPNIHLLQSRSESPSFSGIIRARTVTGVPFA